MIHRTLPKYFILVYFKEIELLIEDKTPHISLTLLYSFIPTKLCISFGREDQKILLNRSNKDKIE